MQPCYVPVRFITKPLHGVSRYTIVLLKVFLNRDVRGLEGWWLILVRQSVGQFPGNLFARAAVYTTPLALFPVPGFPPAIGSLAGFAAFSVPALLFRHELAPSVRG